MEEKRKAYLTIGSARLLDIKVIWDDNDVIYEGMVEDAPQEIKNLKFSKIENSSKMIFYVYSDFNQ